jgi:hypothetical protein
LLARGQLDLSEEEPPDSDEIASAMARLGIYCESEIVVDDDEFWLWPDSEEAFRLWLSIQTQWVIGQSGPSGLNYSGVESYMRMSGMRRSQQPRLLGFIQSMEQAALGEWASKR